MQLSWEYKILGPISIHLLELNLNILGQGGWELITTQDKCFIFKRSTTNIHTFTQTYSDDPQPQEIREEV